VVENYVIRGSGHIFFRNVIAFLSCYRNHKRNPFLKLAIWLHIHKSFLGSTKKTVNIGICGCGVAEQVRKFTLQIFGKRDVWVRLCKSRIFRPWRRSVWENIVLLFNLTIRNIIGVDCLYQTSKLRQETAFHTRFHRPISHRQSNRAKQCFPQHYVFPWCKDTALL
jgi:hypothetical protein